MAGGTTVGRRRYELHAEDDARLNRAREAAEQMRTRLVGRSKYPLRDCPIRIEFIRRLEGSPSPTPMMRMIGLGGGRGGDVRLKLYLSLVWSSPGGTHSTDFQASDWAQLLGLPKFSTNGKRRVIEAIQWLEAEEFLAVKRFDGRASELTVLSDRGDGQPYSKPSHGAKKGAEPSYRNLQSAWWTSGWIAAVSGRALGLWLILLDEVSAADPGRPVWLAESVTTDRYGFSPYLRQEAMRELARHAFIDRQRKLRDVAFKVKSSRTEIRLDLSRLSEHPTIHS